MGFFQNKKNDKKAVKKVTKVDKIVKTVQKAKEVIKYTDEEFRILVCVTFLEAGNQSYKGKLATANAVINRVLSKQFPNSIKGVVYQKYAGRYQFALCAPGGKLEQAMKLAGAVSMGSEAKMVIQAGEVLVNSEVELRRGKKLRDGDIFTYENNDYRIVGA